MHNFVRLVSAIVLALTMNLFVLWSASVAASLTGCGGEIIGASNLQFEQQVVALANQARGVEGLPPLKFNPMLSNAARYLATDMAQDDYFAHDTYDRISEQLVRVCQWSERIKQYYSAPVAENVATGFSSPATVMQAWMESQGHRTNVLSSAPREIGVGYSETYWVQDFGKESSVYPVIINSEALTTASLDVELYIYGEWDQVRVRNNDGEWSAWQPFQNQFKWRLNASPGLHIVEAEMQKDTLTAHHRDEIEVVEPLFVDEKNIELATKTLFLPILHR